ncbi:MAG: glycosyltransferase family 2 protein [Lachnospiraceae bacterium]
MKKWMIDARDFIRSPKLCLTERKTIQNFFAQTPEIMDITGEKMKKEDIDVWKNALLYYAISSPRFAKKIAEQFCCCSVVLEKEKQFEDASDPIYLCVVKDDLKRIQMSYEHHKSIGIKNFVFIDNGSTDGTYEWLMEQDVCVCRTMDKFIMWAKVAWISKVINYFGFERWYLILDSDELFAYPGMEEQPITEYVKYLKQHGYERAFSFMLDMYSKEAIFEGDSGEDIKEAYRYFDTDTYKLGSCMHYQKIVGGPRERLLTDENRMEMLQNKYPLVFYRKGDIYRYHYVSPFEKNFGMPCTSALLHYKFLNGDLEKYKKIAADGNYAQGSQLYKKTLHALEGKDKFSFYSNHSAAYDTSEDLLRCEMINDWRK